MGRDSCVPGWEPSAGSCSYLGALGPILSGCSSSGSTSSAGAGAEDGSTLHRRTPAPSPLAAPMLAPKGACDPSHAGYLRPLS
jgi:hypothetical protein